MCVGVCRRVATVASVLLLAGCGAAAPNSSSTQAGTITGVVEFRACGGPPPVDSPAPCVFRPMAGARVDFELRRQIVVSATTDATGRYLVSVAPGTYTAHIVIAQSSATVEDSRTVTVEPGQRVVADFQLTFRAV